MSILDDTTPTRTFRMKIDIDPEKVENNEDDGIFITTEHVLGPESDEQGAIFTGLGEEDLIFAMHHFLQVIDAIIDGIGNEFSKTAFRYLREQDYDFEDLSEVPNAISNGENYTND